jgi:hypothetical protein
MMMSTPQPPQQPQVLLDIMVTTVTVIRIMSTGAASHPCNVGAATGFFYESGESKYLITNRHVVVDETREFYPDSLAIRIHTSQAITTQNRDVNIPLYDSERRPVWVEHPTHGSSVDIIAIDLGSHLQAQDFITYWSAKTFVPPSVVLGLGDLVLVLGYPMEFYDRMHNLPITKTGTLASPYGAQFGGKPYFLIDANLQPGTSGSPVILPAGTSRRQRGGVTIGTFPPHLLGINSGEHAVGAVKLGLNVVWYSALIQEIVSQ